MSRNSPKQFREKTAVDLCRRNIEQAEIRLGREELGLPPERGLCLLMLQNATHILASVTRTDETAGLELRIAETHRQRAALDVRLARSDFRVVAGGKGVLS